MSASPVFLSVVVPCYNVGAAIDALLASVTAQMSDADELVLVDDGSVDDTAARIRAFVARSPRGAQIVLEQTPNAGAARARALGLSLARGEFVFFCDSDDVLDPGFIATLRREHARYPAMDLLFFSSEMVTERDGRLIPVAPKVAYAQARTYADGSELLAHHLRQRMYTAAVWTYVARRALIERSGAAFTDRSAHEDHLFTLTVILSARLIVAVPDLLYRQRVRDGSLTNSSKSASYVVDRITAADEAMVALRDRPAPLRRLYDDWSFYSVMWMLWDNRDLIGAVARTPEGRAYLAARPLRVLGFAARAARRALRGG
ncbi:glycosyltransferase [Sphingomonas sp. BK580]|uniref:glycosyltransferase n=1 Tax=Sphingomonas sp. BK580 TaxID=2586972 RepID=UPI00160F05E4|nr:glycosyltransferase [Sphingomonas sp. BK580]MBB3694662.1 glycosyltransferase involved in cell wall biosynthesis [Sphingomonas sp. BK580]